MLINVLCSSTYPKGHSQLGSCSEIVLSNLLMRWSEMSLWASKSEKIISLWGLRVDDVRADPHINTATGVSGGGMWLKQLLITCVPFRSVERC